MKEIKLEKGERIDDLEYKGYQIVQKEDGFCFGIDAVLLSDFAKNIKPNSMVMDLGTGNGILGILLCAKTKLKKIYGIEVQKEICELAKKSICLNQLESRFEVVHCNVKELLSKYEKQTIDAIVTNPPYQKKNTGLTGTSSYQNIARHEIEAELEDFIKISSQLLKPKGELYMVHRPERLVDLIANMRKYQLEPKQLRMVAPMLGKEPNLVLIKAVHNGKPFLKIDKTLYVYTQEGNYTDEILEIYHKKEEK